MPQEGFTLYPLLTSLTKCMMKVIYESLISIALARWNLLISSLQKQIGRIYCWISLEIKESTSSHISFKLFTDLKKSLCELHQKGREFYQLRSICSGRVAIKILYRPISRHLHILIIILPTISGKVKK